MLEYRKYGNSPFFTVLVHGGPGASGQMLPVAKELSKYTGILEPLQTKHSINEQLTELYKIIKEHAYKTVVLIGHSWGAWLSFLFSARYSSLVSKLIMIGAGPFEKKYVKNLMNTRLQRLNEEEKKKLNIYLEQLDNDTIMDKNAVFSEIGKLALRSDTYHPINNCGEEIRCRYDIFEKVWPEADTMRSSGKLLEYSKRIKCKVMAIHGDYDSHPIDGVRIPLSKAIKDFKFSILKKCGHEPWNELFAREKFYNILKNEILNEVKGK